MIRTRRILGRVWPFAVVLLVACSTGLALNAYAASLTTQIKISINSTLSSVLDMVTAQAPMAELSTTSFTNGVAANQADTIWTDTRSLATGATEDLDLAGGALTDAFGVAFAPAKVKAIYIKAAAANTTNLTLFGDALSVPILNTAATTVTLQPGGIFMLIEPPLAGIAVGAGATDIIQIANAAGATAYYDIVVIGTSS